jgi:predicted dehydrogenase
MVAMRLVNIGLIGCGGISRSHIDAYMALKNKTRLVAVCDAVEEKAKATMKNVRAETYFLDYRKLLENKDIEAVDICLPHDLHSPVAVAAAEHGKHVLCEKPIARSLEEADAMIAAAERNRVKLQIGENFRFIPEVMKARQLIQDGTIGEVFLAKTDCVGFPTDLASSVWKLDASRVGGGVVIDSGIHFIDIMRWLVGEVSYVTAFLNRIVRKEISGEDTGCILFKHINEAISMLTLTWAARRVKGENLFKIYGSKGMIVNGEGSVILLMADNPDGFSKINIEPKDSFTAEIEHFADCIIQDSEPLMSGKEARRDLELVLAAYTSAKKGKTIKV